MLGSCWCDASTRVSSDALVEDGCGAADHGPPTCCGDAGDASDSDCSASSASCSEDSVWCNTFACGEARFHFVPRNGWHPFLRKMHCAARNTMEWVGKAPVPKSPGDCWLLPTSDEMAVSIARLQSPLAEAGWKLLTCSPRTVLTLSNKAMLYERARAVGREWAMPRQYPSPGEAVYPCILKASRGQHGKDVFIVSSAEEVASVTTSGFGDLWVLQELVLGSTEYSVSLLVEGGKILDAICMEYEFDREAYVWPHVLEVGRSALSNIPKQHLDTMCAFLVGYSGLCNFNYKVRPTGAMCIFEVNARVGADLACDAPRQRARELFQRLDELSHRKRPPRRER